MKHFNFKRQDLTSGPHLLGTLLLIAGLFALVSPVFFESESTFSRILSVGLGAVILGLVIIFSYDGTLIDFTQKRFKEYSSFAGYKFGEWMTLPGISKVKVISTSYLSRNTPNGVSPTLSGKLTDFKVFVYSDSSKPLFSFDYSNMNKAVERAENFASNLNAELDFDIPEKE